MRYSTAGEREAMLGSYDRPYTAKDSPAFVLDMDGNCLIGYHMKDGVPLPMPGRYRNAERQYIPTDADIARLQSHGLVQPKIFAKGGLDVRLPKALVDTLNRRIDVGDFFTINFLTSRGFDEAYFILEQSGVKHPELVTLVGDSGHVIQLGGVKRQLRPLNGEEQAFIDGVAGLRDDVNRQIGVLLAKEGYDPSAWKPVTLEDTKAAARNLHYYELLASLKIDEAHPLAQKIAGIVKQAMRDYMTHAPLDPATHKPIFTMIPGAKTFEIKLASSNKYVGLKAIMDGMHAAGRTPKVLTFAGDDAFKWDEGADGKLVLSSDHGTDHPAMAYTKDWLGHEYGARGEVIYTHHPLRDSLLPPANEEERRLSVMPDPRHAIPKDSRLSPSELHGIDLILPTPIDTAGFVVEAVERMEKQRARSDATNHTARESARKTSGQGGGLGVN